MQEILSQLCKERQHLARVASIYSYLPSDTKIDNYGAGVNLYYTKDFGKPRTALLTSHHDILNRQSDNCLDNNASIFNLISLAWQLRTSEYNLVFAFVDQEESGGGGIIRTVDQYKFDIHLDFELTAFGKDTVYAKYGTDVGLVDLQEMKMPPNNSAMAHRHLSSKNLAYSGYCLTTLNYDGNYPEHWSYIHSMEDKMELANHFDMANFRKLIANLLMQNQFQIAAV